MLDALGLGLAALVACAQAVPRPAPTGTIAPFIVRGLSAPADEDILDFAAFKLHGLKNFAKEDNDYGRFYDKRSQYVPEVEPLMARHVPDMAVIRAERQLAKRQNSAAQAATISLNDLYAGYLDSQYSGQLEVGTPAQELPVLFDLGSAAIFVATSQCSTAACTGQAKFNPSQSSSFVNTTQRAASLYQQGGALGYIINEVVGLGPYQTPNFTMLLAIYVTNGDLRQANPDAGQRPALPGAGVGILGLSYSAFSSGSGNGTEASSSGSVADASQFIRQTLVGSFVAENRLPRNIMGLFLQRAADSPSAASFRTSGQLVSGSELCIGCIDSSRYTGDLTSVPLVQPAPGYWMILSGGISVNGQAITGSSNLNVVFDSGFTLAPFPTTVVSGIAAAAGARRNTQLDSSLGGTGYQIDCSAAFNVAVTFGGRAFNLDARDLIFPVGRSQSTGQTVCGLTIIGIDDLPPGVDGIAGMPFLKNLYTVYSYDLGGSVSIAQNVANTAAAAVDGQTSAGTVSSGGSNSSPGSNPGTSTSSSAAGTHTLPTSFVAVAVLGAVLLGLVR